MRIAASGGRAAVFAPLDDGAGRSEAVVRRLGSAIALGLIADGEQLPPEAELGDVAAGRDGDAARGALRPAPPRAGGDPARARRRQLRPGVRAGAAPRCPGSAPRNSARRTCASWGSSTPRWPAPPPGSPPNAPPRTRSTDCGDTLETFAGGQPTGGPAPDRRPLPHRDRCRGPVRATHPAGDRAADANWPSCSCSRPAASDGRRPRWPSTARCSRRSSDRDGALARRLTEERIATRTLAMIERHVAPTVAGAGRAGDTARSRRTRPCGLTTPTRPSRRIPRPEVERDPGSTPPPSRPRSVSLVERVFGAVMRLRDRRAATARIRARCTGVDVAGVARRRARRCSRSIATSSSGWA